MDCAMTAKKAWCPCCDELKQEAFCKTQWSLAGVLFRNDTGRKKEPLFPHTGFEQRLSKFEGFTNYITAQ